MASKTFPTNQFCSSIVQLLDAIKYEDNLLAHEERVDALKEIHTQTVSIHICLSPSS